MSAPPISRFDRSPLEEQDGACFLLWIDAVGTFLVCLGARVTIGGPGQGAQVAEIPLLADLSRRHATLVRCGEEYLLEAQAPARIDGRPVLGPTRVSHGSRLQLGESVELTFRLPSALSRTARLEFESHHRPERSLEGVVLLDDTCLLGPQGENHIRCPRWPESVLLYRREDELWCKSRADLFIDGRHHPQGGRVQSGSIVSGMEFQFRLEAVR